MISHDDLFTRRNALLDEWWLADEHQRIIVRVSGGKTQRIKDPAMIERVRVQWVRTIRKYKRMIDAAS